MQERHQTRQDGARAGAGTAARTGWLHHSRWVAPCAVALVATTAWAGPAAGTAPARTQRATIAAAPPTTTLAGVPTDLGTLGGATSVATAVDGDIVVGHADTAGGLHHAFAYDLGAAHPRMRDLGTLGAGGTSAATAVDGHVVVGDSDGRAFAFDLDASDAAMVDLGDFGGTPGDGCATQSFQSAADDVSGGLVVGTSFPDGSPEVFVHDLDAATPAMTSLGPVAADECTPFARPAVDDGLVVGTSHLDDFGDGRAYAYDSTATSPVERDLGTLPGQRYSSAADVDGRVVVGESGHAFAVRLGAVGTAPPPLRDLGVLPGGGSSRATAVDGDLVVGTSKRGASDRAFAFALGDAAARMQGLGTLGGLDSQATDVSGTLVVGDSELASAARNGDPIHAFAYDTAGSTRALTDLGTLGGADSSARAVSGPVVVGSAQDVDGRDRATIWRLGETSTPSLRFARLVTTTPESRAATVTVTRAGSPAAAVTVHFETVTAGSTPSVTSATPGRDFDPVSGTLSFAAGQTERAIRVPIRDDGRLEKPERLAVRLSAPTGGAILGTPREAAVQIRASDQRVDALISRRPGTGYVGDTSYNHSAAHQSLILRARRGGSRVLHVQVQNDGDVANTITVRGSGARAGSRVSYHRAGRDVTRAMRSARGLRFTIGAGGSRRVLVRVTVGRRAGIGSAKPATVSATWLGDSRHTDVVRGTVRVVR